MLRFNLPEVIKNLMIINGIFYLGAVSLEGLNIDLTEYLALYQPGSGFFQPHQLITHMFMHASFGHLFFNMFALWIFGSALEQLWKGRRFINYYLLTGLGAALLHFGAQYLEFQMAVSSLGSDEIRIIKEQGYLALQQGKNFVDPAMAHANSILNTPSVGASGAVFGILLAFGMLFPNQIIYFNLFFPIKAKYFVAIYGALELLNGLTDFGGSVAHFAHLGGMLFGYLILRYWKNKYGSFH